MNELFEAVTKYCEGQIALHKYNIDIYLSNPAGIGEHSDIAEAVVEELKKISEYDDSMEMMKKYW